jgi:hypothetical protein
MLQASGVFMDQKPQAPSADVAPETAPPAARRGVGRRALLRGGAAAAPVLLTLHSGPVAATGTMSCTVASSFVSVATFASRNPGATTLQCSTMNAGHWHALAKECAHKEPKNRPDWAKRKVASYLGASTSRFAHLNGSPADYQVWQVMSLGNAPAQSGELGVLHHILGLALSIDNGGSTVNTGGRMNTPYLAEIWRTYKTSGRYRSTSGAVDWSEAELISWLRMLQYPLPLPQA